MFVLVCVWAARLCLCSFSHRAPLSSTSTSTIVTVVLSFSACVFFRLSSPRLAVFRLRSFATLLTPRRPPIVDCFRLLVQVDSDSANEENGSQARRALGQLLGQALHLLDPKGAETEAASDPSGNPQQAQDGSAGISNNGPPMGELLEVSSAGGE